ncbi:tail-related protein [Alteromonas phage vB_AmeP_PT11-V19]|nr:tail-related protein [Alteromonas phage vB_AmeP_PT11-V19]
MKIINKSVGDVEETIPEESQEPVSQYVKKSELALMLRDFAAKEHQHSAYSLAGLDTLMGSKANASHTHEMADISGLGTAIAKKANVNHMHKMQVIEGLLEALASKAALNHKHKKADITDLSVFNNFNSGLVPAGSSDTTKFLRADGNWADTLSLNDVARNLNDMLPSTALEHPSYSDIKGNVNDVLPITAKRWPNFNEITGNIDGLLPTTALRWPSFTEISGDINDVLPEDFNAPIEFGDIVGDVDDILPDTAKRWPSYEEIEGSIESQLTDHALRWPSWFEVTGDIDNVLPETAKRWPYYSEIIGDIEDYLPETALRWPRYDEIVGSFLAMLPETAIRWPTLKELGIDNIDGGTTITLPDNDLTENPTDPYNFSANAGIDFVILSWNTANYVGHAYTELYRFTDDTDNPTTNPTVNDAVKVGETTGFIYTDSVDMGSAHYYWIRFVNSEGVAGTFNPVGTGLYVQTSLNYDALIGQAKQDVLDSLSIWQNSIKEATDILDNEFFSTILNLTGTVNDLTDQTLLTENRLQTKYDLTVEENRNQYQNSITKTEELAASIFETDEEGNVIYDGDGSPFFAGAFVTSVDKVIATETSVLAQSQNQLAAAVFQVNEDGSYVVDENGNPVVSGAFSDTIERVTATERQVTASKIDRVTASIFETDEEGNIRTDENGDPLITGAFSETINAVNADDFSSTAAVIDELSSSIFIKDENGNLIKDNEGKPILVSAFIDSVDATLAAVNGELMAAVGETLKIDTGSEEYTLSEIMAISVDSAGKYEGQWGIKTTINDLQYGVGFVARTDESGNQRTGFHVAADTFSVHNPANGEEIFPLIIDQQGNVLINHAVIDTAVISDLVAETIVTNSLFAGEEIVSPVIKGGEISINDKFIVNDDGSMTGRDVTLYDESGNVMLDADGVSGTYIKDLSVDTLKIKANAITVPLYVESEEVFTDHTYETILDYEYTQDFSSNVVASFNLIASRQRDTNDAADAVSIFLRLYHNDVQVESLFLYEIYIDSGGGQNFSFSIPLIASSYLESGNVRVFISARGRANNQQIKFKAQGTIINAKR